jgi:hypothetical protein
MPGQERRFHSQDEHPARMVCRVCLAFIFLEPRRISYDDGYWVMHCPLCEGSFPVRAGDAIRVA